MSLSCKCDFDTEYSWYYECPQGYTTLQTKRRRRCKSCHAPIEIGAICTKFEISRPWGWEVEERIYNVDDVPLAPHHHCEACADQYFNLSALGYDCIAPNENVMILLREYYTRHNQVKDITWYISSGFFGYATEVSSRQNGRCCSYMGCWLCI
jgi:hypothetical protein